MGNKKQAVETKKRKKKGRPSLLELQKRSLRLQKQEEKQPKLSNPNPNPNPYLKFPTRRSTRRNPNLDEEDEDEEEEEEDSSAKRKEKKLKLVLRIPNGSELGGSGSESEGSRKKRKIGDVEQTARQNSNSKATDEAAQGDPLDSGPTTLLPDKKLLVFILDRLQKKDTYGVFSEPVDPEELPDYHEIIEHPMDFGTIRKKLESGAYENLEQFEGDVFLISSNAMRYNAPDTIYFRQARSIQEIAKKDFENLRQESDDNEEEPKTVRRGRPPIKNIMKRIGRPPADRTGSDFSSDATLASARDGTHSSNLTHDLSRKGSSLDKPSTVDTHRGNSQHRLERNEEYSGSPLKGIPMRSWKKISVMDENRRNTYSQPLQSICSQEPSILTAFEGEKKFLMPVGLYTEHAYARSLARFAANLGPVGWEIAAKRIEKVLPPGTKFGRGWIGIGGREPANIKFRPPPQVSPSSSSSSHLSAQAKSLGKLELASNNSTSSTITSKPVGAMDGAENGRILSGGAGMHRKNPLQLCQNSPMQLPVNGFNPGYGLKHPSQVLKMNPNVRLPDVVMTHGHVLDLVSRSSENHQVPFARHIDAEEKARSVVGNLDPTNAGHLVPDSNCNSEIGEWRGTSVKQNLGSVPPDLNVDFNSPASSVSGALADSKQSQQEQPELALQL